MPGKLTTISLRDLVAIVLLMAGLQLRAVETYELSPGTTQLLAGFVGPAPESPHGVLRQVVIETIQHRHRITPPSWLGWSCLSVGSVLVVKRLLKR